jgi:adenosine deaminase
LPGANLWDDANSYTAIVGDCRSDAPGADRPSPPCAAFLTASAKATQQWELERRFHAFEANFD